jgi:hypothetical protein
MKPLSLWFLAIVGLASFSASCTDAGRCQLGAVGCLCASGECERGGRCVTGVCEFCTAGTVGCSCEGNSCLQGASCVAGRCEVCPLGAEGCRCSSGGCNAGLACVTSEDLCVAEDETVCEESCFDGWHGDGYCDDGGPDSSYSSCNLGTDCTDCGARRNTCVNPEYPTFCPEAPDTPCWTPFTDCDSIAFCGDDTTAHACNTGFRYDCATETCVANTCADPEFPVFCDYDPSCATSGLCCFRTNTDCRTATQCHGNWYACRGRRAISPLTIACGAAVADVACVLPPP